ncbi:MAG: hypothetical protein M3494_15905 [Actinomycetota bacterium]|jgi:hypothetical protein|nr:hypothetical protein [Rubrobacter sp.]MDQ3509470.1 hypothetical protein [Actinomycetota bacterium]
MLPGNGDFEAMWREARKAARGFRRARFGALPSRLGRCLKHRLSGIPACCENCCDALACFSEEAAPHRKNPDANKKFGAIEVERIVGSVGRCRAFDGDFLPACSCTRDRWERVNGAFRDGKTTFPGRASRSEGTK